MKIKSAWTASPNPVSHLAGFKRRTSDKHLPSLKAPVEASKLQLPQPSSNHQTHRPHSPKMSHTDYLEPFQDSYNNKTSHHNASGNNIGNPNDYLLEPVELGPLGGAAAILNVEKEFEQAGTKATGWWANFTKKEKPVEEQKPKVSMRQLFRFATQQEMLWMLVGIVAAAASGVIQIVVSIIIGYVFRACV